MMRRSSQQNYVCWRCLSLRPAERAPWQHRTLPSATAPSALSTTTALVTAASFSTASTASTASPAAPAATAVTWPAWPTRPTPTWSLHNPPVATRPLLQLRCSLPPRPKHGKSAIREELRAWEAANPSAAIGLPRDVPAEGRASNTATRTQTDTTLGLDFITQDDQLDRPHFDGVDGVDMDDLAPSGPPLQPGDLVEIRSRSGDLRIVAVCLGHFGDHAHFYSSTGKWFAARSVRTCFVVRRFVADPADLQPVVDAIPSHSTDTAVLGKLRDDNVGPSRELAASLLAKMRAFQSAAGDIHQAHVESLTRARHKFGPDARILSLREVADALLPVNLKQGKPDFPPEALYAVFSALEDDDIAFRVLDRAPRHHESHLFALHSADTQKTVLLAEKRVRAYLENPVDPAAPGPADPSSAEFAAFLDQARALIDQVRLKRSWSAHGMIGPRSDASPEPALNLDARWSPLGRSLVEFMHHWAAADAFRLGSRSHWIGASILRSLGRYNEALLDTTTGWTFLQEIGWVAPWDIPARYALSPPGVPVARHPNLPAPPAPPPKPETAPVLGDDKLAPLRRQVSHGSTVYCIDSADTLDVDDGISLEPAGDGKYWIHIHVADPASRLSHDQDITQLAARRAQTSYLAAFGQRMLEHDAVRHEFSLGPDRPALTFSALVTESGRLLDSKVTPEILRDVTYITPETVAAVVSHSNPPVPDTVLEVGVPPQHDTPVREMTSASGLTTEQKEELLTLSKLATAIQRTRLSKGAIPMYPPKPQASVSVEWLLHGANDDRSAFYVDDPYIRVAYSGQGDPLVSSLMQLAGEVGARFCYERNIPVPYRIQQLPGGGATALRAFSRDVLYPQLVAGKNPSAEDWHTLGTFMGGFDLSTMPAPNLAMGIDLYTKVTSPLRRYSDLLVHWQIEAALLEEHRRGKSLVVRKFPASADDVASPAAPTGEATQNSLSFLPFSEKQLNEKTLPHLRVYERLARRRDNIQGNSQWILQALVRAWRFGEGSPTLPETFRFTVFEVVPKNLARGQIDWFERRVTVDLEDLNGVTKLADMKRGDVFKVELVNVNVYTDQVNVRLLEKL
ncbi:hypothetical protein C8A05DRAFT_40413 [Staphylotrichum tortipilum]|uniref:RNB domain-containing protein n=1 Tax=Staphylotrichum tortipilum TaxID=2831512 RepID=A0AAN6MUS4_9PEZI|nr:hypothetical protein C8A05DRAFT_40413 [Staphylotrichum longicolle]